MFVGVNPFGCDGKLTIDYRVVPRPQARFDFPTNIQCFKGNRFEFNNTSDGKGYELTHEWLINHQQRYTEESLSLPFEVAGTYGVSLKVTNPYGCIDSMMSSLPIDFYATPRARLQTSVDSLCLLGNEFEFTDSSILSAGNYSVRLGLSGVDTVNFSGSFVHQFAKSGVYIVDLFMVTDNNCMDTVQREVVVFDMPRASFVSDYREGCEGKAIFRFKNESDDDGQSEYIWTYDGRVAIDSVSGLTHTFDRFGKYEISLEVITKNQCRDTANMEMVIHPMPVLDYHLVDAAQCDKGHSFDLQSRSTISGGTIDEFWNIESVGIVAGSEVKDLRFALPGVKEVKYVIASDKGCMDSVLIELEVYPSPVSVFNADTLEQCLRGNVFKLNDASTIYSGQIALMEWFTDSFSKVGEGVNHELRLGNHGEWKVAQRVLSDKGCADTSYKSLRVYLNPVAGFKKELIQECFQDHVLEVWGEATGFGSDLTKKYYLSDLSVYENTDYFTHRFDFPGRYEIRQLVSDDRGCMDTALAMVEIKSQPRAKMLTDGIGRNCLNDHAFNFTDISESNGQNYRRIWQVSDQSFQGSDSIIMGHYFAVPGTKKVYLKVEGDNGCISWDSVSVNIHEQSDLRLDLDQQEACLDLQNFRVRYNGKVDVSTFNEFYWEFGDSTLYTSKDVVKSFTKAGLYSNRLITENENGCRDTLTFQLMVKPMPQARMVANDTMWCMREQQIQLSSKAIFDEGNIQQFTWVLSDGSTSVGREFNPKKFVQPGRYPVKHIVVADNQCSDTAVLFLQIFNNPVASLSTNNAMACLKGNDMHIRSRSTFFGARQQEYWNIPAIGYVDSGDHLSLSFKTHGQYPFSLVSVDDKGCSDTVSGLITIHPQAVVDFVTDSVCLGDMNTFTDASTVNPGQIVQHQWFIGGKKAESGKIVSHSFKKPGYYDVRLITTTDAGCKDTLEVKEVALVRKLPVADFSYQKTMDSLQFTGYQFTDNSSGESALTYDWVFNRTGFSNQQNPWHAFEDTGNITVALRVVDKHGCEDETEQHFVTYPDSRVFIPNAFSPNSDPHNPVFKVYGLYAVQRFNMKIFNRWGEKLYETDHLHDVWDGTFNGQDVPEGVYVYVVNFVSITGKFERMFGDVTLLR